VETDEKIKDKLVKLVKLLSSDKDGERLAACAAIERTLKSAGMSWHELADTIANKIMEVTKVVTVDAKADADSWIRAADQILEKRDSLVEYEAKFVEDIRQRFKLRPGYMPTDKQTNWFTILYRRVVA
jgi:hypothetical protein